MAAAAAAAARRYDRRPLYTLAARRSAAAEATHAHAMAMAGCLLMPHRMAAAALARPRGSAACAGSCPPSGGIWPGSWLPAVPPRVAQLARCSAAAPQRCRPRSLRLFLLLSDERWLLADKPRRA
eukprot:COSAG01_NODE_6091_length_3855_cov_135.425453_1_plen_125_part_00